MIIRLVADSSPLCVPAVSPTRGDDIAHTVHRHPPEPVLNPTTTLGALIAYAVRVCSAWTAIALRTALHTDPRQACWSTEIAELSRQVMHIYNYHLKPEKLAGFLRGHATTGMDTHGMLPKQKMMRLGAVYGGRVDALTAALEGGAVNEFTVEQVYQKRFLQGNADACTTDTERNSVQDMLINLAFETDVL